MEKNLSRVLKNLPDLNMELDKDGIDGTTYVQRVVFEDHMPGGGLPQVFPGNRHTVLMTRDSPGFQDQRMDPVCVTKDPQELEDELAAFADESSLPFSETGLFHRTGTEVLKKSSKGIYKLMRVQDSAEIPSSVTDLVLEGKDECYLKLPSVSQTKHPIHFTYKQGTSYRMFANKDEHIEGHSGTRIHPGDVGTFLPNKDNNVVC